MKNTDIELAFEFVSSGSPYEHTAYISKSTGETFFQSDLSGEDDLPEGYEEDEDLLEIPHKNDLDLGTALVWEFVGNNLPEDHGRIRGIFSSRGAYGRFKSYLDGKGILDSWYEFEEAKTKEAIRNWCRENGISVEE